MGRRVGDRDQLEPVAQEHQVRDVFDLRDHARAHDADPQPPLAHLDHRPGTAAAWRAAARSRRAPAAPPAWSRPRPRARPTTTRRSPPPGPGRTRPRSRWCGRRCGRSSAAASSSSVSPGSRSRPGCQHSVEVDRAVVGGAEPVRAERARQPADRAEAAGCRSAPPSTARPPGSTWRSRRTSSATSRRRPSPSPRGRDRPASRPGRRRPRSPCTSSRTRRGSPWGHGCARACAGRPACCRRRTPPRRAARESLTAPITCAWVGGAARRGVEPLDLRVPLAVEPGGERRHGRRHAVPGERSRSASSPARASPTSGSRPACARRRPPH